MRDGVVHNDGDELAVSPTVPAAMSVDVGTGMALVQGRYYINDAALTLAVEAADPSYPRIDRVVVRADLVVRTVHAVVKKGTAAASPVPPTLTRTAEIWELSLAQVRVEAGATSIVAAKITDERGNASLCGVAAPVYVPSTQLEVVGAVDMQGKALTGLPVPSAATDAARRNMGGVTLQGLGTPSASTDAATKAYVDSATVPKLSALVMDADKNWGGRNITNVGTIRATNYSLAHMFVDVPGTTLRKQLDLNISTSTGNTWVPVTSVAVPDNYHPSVDSNCRVSVPVTFAAAHSSPVPIQFRAVVDGGVIGTGNISLSQGDVKTCTFDTTGGFVAGDSIAIEMQIASSSPQGTATATGLTLRSSRATNQPVPATYVEAGTW